MQRPVVPSVATKCFRMLSFSNFIIYLLVCVLYFIDAQVFLVHFIRASCPPSNVFIGMVIEWRFFYSVPGVNMNATPVLMKVIVTLMATTHLKIYYMLTTFFYVFLAGCLPRKQSARCTSAWIVRVCSLRTTRKGIWRCTTQGRAMTRLANR
jgi:hypothetical protein